MREGTRRSVDRLRTGPKAYRISGLQGKPGPQAGEVCDFVMLLKGNEVSRFRAVAWGSNATTLATLVFGCYPILTVTGFYQPAIGRGSLDPAEYRGPV